MDDRDQLRTPAEPGVIADRPPLPLWTAVRALVRCALTTFALLRRQAISQPRKHVGSILCFANGTRARVYRETTVSSARTDAPVVLVVAFELRWIRGWGHALFRAESLLNTPLFVGFPGFVSKLWLAHDEHDVYRGLYQWNDPVLADAYVRALWWVLALVSVRGSIRYAVLPGLRRDDVLDDPAVLAPRAPDELAAWWRLESVMPRQRSQQTTLLTGNVHESGWGDLNFRPVDPQSDRRRRLAK
jgi:hypothetical protein